MIANKEKGEFITDDGKLEITFEEYNKRTDEDMSKHFWIWFGLTALSVLAIVLF